MRIYPTLPALPNASIYTFLEGCPLPPVESEYPHQDDSIGDLKQAFPAPGCNSAKITPPLLSFGLPGGNPRLNPFYCYPGELIPGATGGILWARRGP